MVAHCTHTYNRRHHRVVFIMQQSERVRRKFENHRNTRTIRKDAHEMTHDYILFWDFD